MLALRDSKPRHSKQYRPQYDAPAIPSRQQDPYARPSYDPPAHRTFGSHDPRDRFFDNDFGPPSLLSHSPFEAMDKMMSKFNDMTRGLFEEMHHSMQPMASGFNEIPSNGAPRYIQKVYSSSTTYDRNGNPVTQKYQSQSYGTVDRNGQRINERKQLYHNSGTGLEKYAHERVLGHKGRKVVEERLGQNQMRSDIFRGMGEADAANFDQEWSQVAGQGFTGYALPAPSGYRYGQRAINERPRREDYFDEDRRGDYVPNSYKQSHMPVRVNQNVPRAQAAAIQAPRNQRPAKRKVPKALPLAGA